MKKKILCIVVSLILCMSSTVISYAEEGETENVPNENKIENQQEKEEDFSATEELQGKCGDTLTWRFYEEDGSLVISGTGKMYDYKNDYSAENPVPWKNLNVESVVINDGVTSIGDYAFYSCEELRDLKIAEGITEIGEYAFWGCTGLTDITIPESVIYIGSSAFAYCNNITCIEIPSKVAKVDNIFVSCEKLVEIKVDPNNHELSSQDGVLFNKSKTELICYPSAKGQEYTIPESVTDINEDAFCYCTQLVSITIPDGIKSIKSGAFMGCYRLRNIVIPGSVKSIGSMAFWQCDFVNLTIPEGVTEIGSEAFQACWSLKSITLPKSLTKLESCFSLCDSLQEIIMKGDAPEFKDGTFSETGISDDLVIKVPKGAKGYDKSPWDNYKIVYIPELPLPITNLRAVSAGAKRVKLSWNASDKAEGYLIYAQKDWKYGYCGMTSKTTFVDTKALDTDYNFYWVFPYVTDSSGKMHPVDCQKYVYAKGVTAAVQNLKASSQSGGVKLTWSASFSAEGYLIYGRTGDGAYGYRGMTKQTNFTDKKASKKDYNYYWVYPYHTDFNGKMIVGGTPKYVYGKAK